MLAALLATAAPSRPAHAQTDGSSEPIRVVYSAYAGCPGPEAFTAEVGRRTRRARVANEGEVARTFVVVVEREGARTLGRLAIRALDGAESAREVRGAGCSEVVSALALVAALAIDPKANAEPGAELPAVVGAEGAPPQTIEGTSTSGGSSAGGAGGPGGAGADGNGGKAPPPAASGGAGGGNAADAGGMSSAPPPRAPPAAPPRLERELDPSRKGRERSGAGSTRSPRQHGSSKPSTLGPSPWAWQMGLQAGGIGAVAPSMVFAVQAHVGLSREGAGLLRPTFRADYVHAESGLIDATAVQAADGTTPPVAATATLVFNAARIEGCYFALSLGEPVTLKPCLAATVGALRGQGAGDIPNARAETRPWFDVAALARLEWMLADLFVVEAQGGLLVPVTRDRFYFEPNVTVHEVPAVAPMASAGLSLRFP